MKFLFLFILVINFNGSFAQEIENDFQNFESYSLTSFPIKKEPAGLKIRQLIFPATCIGYGFVALNAHPLQNLNKSAKRHIKPGTPFYTTTIDNYLQYLPAISVYGLNASGIKGQNNFKDRTIMYGLANIFTCAFISPLKNISNIERPDQSANNSFPSGHTATAFAAAEFLRQEYKNVSVWYGVGGYLAATTTGILRVYNNRHWLSDIIAGAGIGILSTKIAYLIYPYIKKSVFKSNKPATTFLNAEDINNLPVVYYAN